MHCFPPDSRSHGRHVGSPGFKFINGAFFASKGSLAIRRHQGFLLQTARPSAAREERSEPRSKRFNNLRPSSISSMRGPLHGQPSESPPHIIKCTRYKLRDKLGKIAIGGRARRVWYFPARAIEAFDLIRAAQPEKGRAAGPLARSQIRARRRLTPTALAAACSAGRVLEAGHVAENKCRFGPGRGPHRVRPPQPEAFARQHRRGRHRCAPSGRRINRPEQPPGS